MIPFIFWTVIVLGALYLTTVVISAFGHGWKGISLVFGVAACIFSSHNGPNFGVVAATGCLLIGSSMTAAILEAVHAKRQ